MLGRILSIAVIIAACYWYWSGPYQAKNNPNYDQRLEKNAENMALCMRGAAYKAGATGQGSGDNKEQCAERFNLYEHEGKWHSYDEKRRDD